MLLTTKDQLVSLAKKYLNTNLKRYIVVGGFAYVTEMMVIFFGVKVFNLNNVIVVGISFWVGFVVAFILQKLITFGNLDKRFHIVGKQLIIYGVLIAFNYLLTLMAVNIFSKYMSVYLIRTLIILFITVINFNVYKIIFKNTK